MYWNIQKFAMNKMTGEARTRNFTPGPRRVVYNNPIKGDYIIDTLFAHDQLGNALEPDFFVVVEVTTGRTVPIGSTVDGAGAEGVRHLYTRLPVVWHVVPPLVTGTGGSAEGIAVFFRSDVWEFIGPWYWNGAISQAAQAGEQNYDGIWANVLPVGSRSRAGQTVFTAADGSPLNFPDPMNRSPFLTRFQRRLAVGQPPPANREIVNILAYHAPSTAPYRETGTRRLADIPAVNAPLAPNETFLVLGDFNCNVMHANGAAAFTPLINAGFQQCITPAHGYTMLKDTYGKRSEEHLGPSRDKASTRGNYPNYDYLRPAAVDNIFIKPARAVVPVCSVVNRVIGTPTPAAANTYDNPANRPVGNLYSIEMNDSIQQINAGHPAGRSRKFLSMPNFGTIGGGRGTSDHMALVIDF